MADVIVVVVVEEEEEDNEEDLDGFPSLNKTSLEIGTNPVDFRYAAQIKDPCPLS